MTPEVQSDVQDYISWVMARLAEMAGRDLAAALTSLKAALRNPAVQAQVATEQGLVRQARARTHTHTHDSEAYQYW